MPVKITVPNLPASPIVKLPEPLTTPLIVRVVPVAVDTVPPRLPIARLTVVAGPVEFAALLVKIPLFSVMIAEA